MTKQTQYITIWSDGGARSNPGPAGIGAVIAKTNLADPSDLRAEHLIRELSSYIGQATNNQAEYRALLTALEWLSKEALVDPRETVLQIYTDSELLAYQIQGRYRLKNADLRPLYEAVRELLSRYQSYTITPIRRELNQRADQLVNQAIDQAYSQSSH